MLAGGCDGVRISAGVPVCLRRIIFCSSLVSSPTVTRARVGQMPRLGQIDRFSLHDVDLPRRTGLFPMWYDVARVAGWKAYNLHDVLLGHVSCDGSVPCRSNAGKHVTTAGGGVVDLDHDQPDLSEEFKI